MKFTVINSGLYRSIHFLPTLIFWGCCLYAAGSSVVVAGIEAPDEIKVMLSEEQVIIAKSSQPEGDYLDALSDEAESTAKVPADSGIDKAYAKNVVKMETLIKEKKPSLYSFYMKLNSGNKAEIYKRYVADNSAVDERLKHIRKTVLDLYFAQ